MSMLDDDGPKPKKRKKLGRIRIAQGTLFLVGIPIVCLLVMLSLMDQCSKTPPPKDTPMEPKSGAIAPSSHDEAVASLAQRLAPNGTLAELHQAMFTLSSQAPNTRGGALERPMEPRAPYQLAQSIVQGESLRVRPYEWGLLFGDLARNLGHTVTYAEAKGVQHARTDVNRKELGIVDSKSPSFFLNPWTGASVDAAESRELTIQKVAAYGDGIAVLEHLEDAEVEEGMKRLEGALKHLPDDPALLLVQGQLVLASGQTENGIALLAKSAQLGKDAHAHFVLGTAYLVEESLFKAFKEFQAATRMDPKFAEAWLAMGGVELKRLEMTPKEGHDSLLGRVEEHLNRAQKADPLLDGLATAKAQVALLRGDEAGAKAVLEKAVEDFPNRPEPAILLAQLALQINQLEIALGYLEKASKAAPERMDVRELMGMACAGLGQWAVCTESLLRTLNADPSDLIVRLQLASSLREEGKIPEAMEQLRGQVERFPDDATGHLLLAQLFLDAKDPNEALKHIEKGLLLSPVAEAYVLEFLALRALGKNEEAMGVVSRFGVREPNAHMILSQALLEQGEMEGAEAVLLSWKKHKPDEMDAPLLLTMVYDAMGKKDRADAIQAEALGRTAAEEKDGVRDRFQTQRAQVADMLQEEPATEE